jgi:hypothetical protein
MRKEIDQLRERLNQTINQLNKVQRHLELSSAMWRELASEPWVRFFMWIRPMNHMPYFMRETVYPLRKTRERAPELPLEDVPPAVYDTEENARKRIPQRPTRRRTRASLAELAAGVRDET